MKRSAVISRDGKYRYRLDRRWGTEGGTCCFIMLNPSTADAEQDDPTIKKCIGFTKRLHCDHLIVVNLFAYRATKPDVLKKVSDPVGYANKDHILKAADDADWVIVAWGTHEMAWKRAPFVIQMLIDLEIQIFCLKNTKHRDPMHPLFVPYSKEIERYA